MLLLYKIPLPLRHPQRILPELVVSHHLPRCTPFLHLSNRARHETGRNNFRERQCSPWRASALPFLIRNSARVRTARRDAFVISHTYLPAGRTDRSIWPNSLFNLDSTNSSVSNSTYLLLSPLEGLDEWLQWQEARATIPESWPLECKDVADASRPFGVPVVLPACLLQPPILQTTPCLSSIDIAKDMGIPWYSIRYIAGRPSRPDGMLS